MNPPGIAHHHSAKQVIIVEDDQDLRESLEKYLTLSGHDVTVVATALQFYQQINTQSYALAILDIGLPDQSGLVLAEYLRNNTNMRIIMLTARVSLEDKLAGYQSGADMYLTKPVDFRELSASITTILGRLDVVPAVSQHAMERAVAQYQAAPLVQMKKSWILHCSERALHTPQGDAIELTAKEFDFIYCLLSSGNATASRQEILDMLGYNHDEFGNRSLESLVHRLRNKIETASRISPIKTSHGIGYRFSADLSLG